MIEDLKIIRNHIGNVESSVYDLCLRAPDADIGESVDRLIGDLQFVMIDLEELELKVEKEELLRSQNKTLRSLYNEYTTVRDLIGSEK